MMKLIVVISVIMVLYSFNEWLLKRFNYVNKHSTVIYCVWSTFFCLDTIQTTSAYSRKAFCNSWSHVLFRKHTDSVIGNAHCYQKWNNIYKQAYKQIFSLNLRANFHGISCCHFCASRGLLWRSKNESTERDLFCVQTSSVGCVASEKNVTG